MLRFLLTRFSLIIPTFIGMTLLAFFLIRLVPGDPIETLAGERGIDATRHAVLLKEYGLDRPILVQYGIYIGRVLQGDLGKSIITHEPVMNEFLALFPATIELALCAILFALLLGIPAGILAAVRRNTVFDHGVMGASLTGKDVAMIFQEPTSLNPCFTIGFQIAETLKLHLGLDRKQAKRRSIELLEQVGIPAPESRLKSYPHQMSGGMNQRVMIAIAIACNPKLLIADEPTTALDVKIQAQILDLLRSLQKERGMALVLITHNMGVVSEMAQRVAVMYAG